LLIFENDNLKIGRQVDLEGTMQLKSLKSPSTSG